LPRRKHGREKDAEIPCILPFAMVEYNLAFIIGGYEMETVSLIIKIVLVIFSLFLIVVVLLQSGQKSGLSGAIGGGAEAMFGKKKARGMEAMLVKLTKVAAVGFMVLAVVLAVIQKYFMGA